MIRDIILMVIAGAIITHKPIAKVIGKVADIVSAKKEEKRAYKEAMDKYLSREILDIEH